MKLKTTALALLLAVAPLIQAQPLRYFGQTEQSYQPTQDYGNHAQGAYVQSGDARIYYEVYGKGEPIVVLHGGLVGSIAEMGEFIDRLSPNRQVIAINTRGHGKSDVGTVLPTYAQKAKDVQAVLKALHLGKTDLLGFSDGAYTALTFAAQYPELTGKVVAIGAGEWKKGFVQGTRNPDMKFADLEKYDPAYWLEQQSKVRPNPAQTARWFDTANQTYNQTEVGLDLFKRIQAPTLFVVGEDDKNAPLDTVIAAYKATPHADLAVIPNMPHSLQANFPAIWLSVRDFLQK